MPAAIKQIVSAVLLWTAVFGVAAQEKVLNLYSSRHYQTDEALYSNFTKQTGIRINRIEAPEDALIERLRNEGASSPADVLVTVDAGRLWRAEQMGLLQPVKSALLDSSVPAHLRHPDGLWFGFSTRARVIVYNKDEVKPGQIRSYEDLADPKWKGKVCMRSSSSVYNLSLAAALISHMGEQKAEEWARGVVANFARAPKGGDTDQIKSVAAGECALTQKRAPVRFERPRWTSLELTSRYWTDGRSIAHHHRTRGRGCGANAEASRRARGPRRHPGGLSQRRAS